MLQGLLNKILGSYSNSELKSKFLKASVGSFILQLTLSILTFTTTIIVARLSGDKGFGIYSLVFTWVSVICSFALFGFDDLALKQISIFKSNNKSDEIKSFLFWGLKLVSILSLFVTISYIFFAYYVHIPGLYEYRLFHFVAACSIPFFTIVYYLQAILKALGFISIGQLAEKLVQPVSFIFILFCFYFLGNNIGDLEAIIFRVLSFIVAAIFVLFLVFIKLYKYKNSKIVYLESKSWHKSLIYFTLSTLLFSFNSRVDIIFLGFFSISPEEIAYYNVALKFSDIALIPFLVITTVSTPVFASLFHQNKFSQLQKFYTLVTRIGFLIILGITLIFIIFGTFFLSWYGENFKSANTVLVLLCISKLLHVFVGPANYLLSMTGNERFVTRALLISVSLTIILHLCLIPIYKSVGAAYATIGGLIFYDLYIVYLGFKKTGIYLTIVGKFKQGK